MMGGGRRVQGGKPRKAHFYWIRRGGGDLGRILTPLAPSYTPRLLCRLQARELLPAALSELAALCCAPTPMGTPTIPASPATDDAATPAAAEAPPMRVTPEAFRAWVRRRPELLGVFASFRRCVRRRFVCVCGGVLP